MNSANNQQTLYIKTLASTFMLISLATLIFTVARLAAWSAYTPPDERIISGEFWSALLIGFRFDMAFAARGMILAVLISLVALPFSSKLANPAWMITRILARAVVVLAVLFSVINFAYLDFFNRPIDSFAFIGMAYGTGTAWKTVSGTSNFAALLATTVLALGLSLFVYQMLEKKIVSRIDANANQRKVGPILIVVSLLVIAVIGRGSVTTFPLSYRHLAVSSDSSLNNIVPNGLVALYYGYKDFKKSKQLRVADDAEGRQLYKTFYGKAAAPGELFEQFFTHTEQSDFLEKNPPNVVFNLMESMGQALLLNQFTDGIDLSGSMRQHLNSDFYFQHFLPAQNNTQTSLTSLMLNTEYSDISRSSYKDILMQTSAAKVFRDAGYRTVFVYGGFEGLMNRGSYFRSQGFEEFYGARTLKAMFPQMHESVWGGDDKYVFEQVWKLLSEQSDDPRPLFIMTLSITNHPPYYRPVDRRHSLELNQALSDRLQNLTTDSLETYSYANDLLGELIGRIKQSALGSTTIIAATGDHSIRGMRYDQSEQLHRLSVPFYLYVPNDYKPDTRVDTSQVASHKDVMPTLFNLALSNASYANLGRNLLTTEDATNSAHQFAYNVDYIVLDQNAYRLADSPEKPGHRVSHSFAVTPEASDRDARIERARAYPAILDWLTRYQLLAPRN
jgi:phosphoglycerol transferase MdoB-like AlkP superfamily enzyme